MAKSQWEGEYLCGEKLPEVGSLTEKLVRLDQFLTGAPIHRCLHNHRNQGDGGCHGMYYLSDGGYSRIYLQPYGEGKIFLTSNSLQVVKDRWAAAAELVADLSHALETERSKARR